MTQDEPTQVETPASSPHQAPRGAALLAAGLAVVLGALPPVLYLALFGRWAIRPAEAKAILMEAGTRAALVDVRPPDMYAESHIRGAVSLPLESIKSMRSAGGLPEELRGRRLVLVCNSGRMTALAVRKLHELGLADAVHIRGGIQAWVADARNRTGGPLDQLIVHGREAPPPTRDASAFEQTVHFVAGFLIKPAYGLLSFILILVLWRSRSADLAALRWAMICFFLGEQACAVNYLLFADQSYLMEYLHSLGMTMCFGLATYAIFDGMDRRLIRFSDADARCAALALCARCYKHADVPCGLKRMFLLVIPAMMVLAGLPLSAPIRTPSYNATVFGMWFNYSHAAAYQMFETIYCPIAAAVLLAASLAVLAFRKREPVAWSKVLFAAGMGPLGFGLLRLVLFQPYADNQVWFTFWEEATELLFILGVAYVLWVFRRGLFGRYHRRA